MKTYKLTVEEYENFEATVTIDETSPSLAENLRMSVEFFTDYEDRLAECGGDYTTTFMTQLAEGLCFEALTRNRNLADLQKQQIEGFPPIDGTCGITLTSLDCDRYFTGQCQLL